MGTVLAVAGLLAFLAVVYVAYRLSRTTIGPAYIEVTEQDDSFLHGDFPEQPDRQYRAVHAQRRIAKQPSQMPMRRQP